MYERLNEPSLRIEQGGDNKGRTHDGELRKVILAGERLEESLGRRYAPKSAFQNLF